jgi:hypothetical protein
MPNQNLRAEFQELHNNNDSSSSSTQVLAKILSQPVIFSVNHAVIKMFISCNSCSDIWIDDGLCRLETKITSKTDEINREFLKRYNDQIELQTHNSCDGKEMRLKVLFGLNKVTFELISEIQKFNSYHCSSDHLSHTTPQIEELIFAKVLTLLHSLFLVNTVHNVAS